MKKVWNITVLAFLAVLFAALPFSAQKTQYDVGEYREGLLDNEIRDAIRGAVDKFKDWAYEGVASGYVTKTDDYYLQPFTDGEDRSAAVYVGADRKAYVLRGPVYEQLESVGGFSKLGRPISDAYEVDGVWYQNFERGYVRAAEGKTAEFVSGRRVDSDGRVTDITSSASDRTSSSDRTDLVTDGSIPSPSQQISDAVSDGMQGEPAARWGIWVFVILLLLGVVAFTVYWFVRHK